MAGRGLVLFACLILTVLATYASFGIVINTSTEGIFSSKVEFLRNVRAYERIFPSKGDPIVAVIDAPDGRSRSGGRATDSRRNCAATVFSSAWKCPAPKRISVAPGCCSSTRSNFRAFRISCTRHGTP